MCTHTQPDVKVLKRGFYQSATNVVVPSQKMKKKKTPQSESVKLKFCTKYTKISGAK